MFHSAQRKIPQISIFIFILFLGLCFVAPEFALAQGAPAGMPPTPSFAQLLGKMIPMLAMVLFIFYFMVLKPQQVKMKAHEDMLKTLKKGDRVITAGGIIGRVADIADDGVSLEIAPSVKVKFVASKISKKMDIEEASKKAA